MLSDRDLVRHFTGAKVPRASMITILSKDQFTQDHSPSFEMKKKQVLASAVALFIIESMKTDKKTKAQRQKLIMGDSMHDDHAPAVVEHKIQWLSKILFDLLFSKLAAQHY